MHTPVLLSNNIQRSKFMRGIELDAKERGERMKKNEADAETLKSKGNKEFKSCRYQEAIDCYTAAIKLVKYFPALYTNRAQAYIKLDKFDAAIDDCKWAMKIDEKCVKAYVHCGRALQKKRLFSEAISFFKKGEEIDPNQKDVIAGYISQTEKEQKEYDFECEVNVKYESDPCLKAVGEIIEKLNEKSDLKECTICARQLVELLANSDESKTLFRLLKGFSFFGTTTKFWRLCENCSSWESNEETFVHEMLNLGEITSANNERNAGELLNYKIIDVIHKVCQKCNVQKVLLASVRLLRQLTEFTLGRQHIVDYARHNSCFVERLLKFVEERHAISRIVMGCMNNLSLDKTFASNNSSQLEKILFSLIKAPMTTSDNSKLDRNAQLALVTTGFATLANLARVKRIRNRLQLNVQVWILCVDILTEYDSINEEEIADVIYALLGLLINLLIEDSIHVKSHGIAIAVLILKLLTLENMDIVERLLGVSRLLMTYSNEVVQLVCTESTYDVLLKIVQRTAGDTTISYGVKCLALCTAENRDARKYIISNGLPLFQKLLSSNNDTIVGNSAIVLSSCFEEDEVSEQLFGTSIVKDCLTLATRTDLNKNVKQNVAIALAKLVKHDLRFLEELRELHGVEILHSVVQSNNLI
ncbi:tetratricopeptide repeat protein 12-like isoform X2 [Dendronephthya gigantea]|uniref:tetratricopeptide repeat protein 12-like isoform X2 n=1 Tax=Dendronephthya gigantea TaxID=151771 RepID=UPI00106C6630|nr:tetratricopeptide repeat protein 12-like isoform X2 [Dendronephthya gigantea]